MDREEAFKSEQCREQVMNRILMSLFSVGLSLLSIDGRAGQKPAPLPADGQLVYLRQSAHGCDLKLWSSVDGSDRLLTALPECPKGINVTSGGQALVLLDKVDIRLFTLSDRTLGAPIALPQMDAPKGTDGAGSAQAGYTPDGRIALEMVADHPDDSQELFLFIRNGDTWTQEEHLHCGRFGADCGFKQKFESRPLGGVDSEAEPDLIWSDALRGDPYVTQRIPEMSETYSAIFDGTNTLVFHINGRDSKLSFYEESGEDTGDTGTFRLKLMTPDGRRLDITDEQFDATVVGHYLLFYGYFDEGTRLYDVGDGKVVLDHITSAGWLK